MTSKISACLIPITYKISCNYEDKDLHRDFHLLCDFILFIIYVMMVLDCQGSFVIIAVNWSVCLYKTKRMDITLSCFKINWLTQFVLLWFRLWEFVLLVKFMV